MVTFLMILCVMLYIGGMILASIVAELIEYPVPLWRILLWPVGAWWAMMEPFTEDRTTMTISLIVWAIALVLGLAFWRGAH